MNHRITFVPALALALVLALMGRMALAQTLGGPDRRFLEQAAQDGQAELVASREALTRARNPEVRAFAQHMVDEHSRIDQELRTLARAKGYTPPDEPSLLQKGKQKLMDGLSDEHFDRRYISQMGVDAHQASIELYERAAREARDAEVKAFATQHLPGLREHLRQAQSLSAKVGGSGANGTGSTGTSPSGTGGTGTGNAPRSGER